MDAAQKLFFSTEAFHLILGLGVVALQVAYGCVHYRRNMNREYWDC